MRGIPNVAYRYYFTVKLASGAPATGIAGGSFTVQVRNPQNTATMSAPTVTEVGGGLYYFDVSASFTSTHGSGEYGVSIAVNSGSPAVVDTFGDVVEFGVPIEKYQGAVWARVGGSSGSVVGVNGIPSNPCGNQTDALALMAATGLTTLRLMASGTAFDFTGSWAQKIVEGETTSLSAVDIKTPSGGQMIFKNVAVQATGVYALTGYFYDSLITASVVGYEGYYERCAFVPLGSAFAVQSPLSLIDCWAFDIGAGQEAEFDFSAAGSGLEAHGWSGSMRISSLSAGKTVVVDVKSGKVTVDATCTGGTVTLRGTGEFVDESGGAVTVDKAGFTPDLGIYDGAIWVDVAGGGSAGTVVGVNGTPDNPAVTATQVAALLAATGFKRVKLLTTNGFSLDFGDFTGITLEGVANNASVTLASATPTVTGMRFENVLFTSAIALPETDIEFVRCRVALAVDVVGYFRECTFVDSGAALPVSGTVHMHSCSTEDAGAGASPEFDMSAAGAKLLAYGWTGAMVLSGMVAGRSAEVHMEAGDITVAATCTGGTVVLTGSGKLTDASAGASVDRAGLVPNEAAVHQGWVDDPTLSSGTMRVECALHQNGQFVAPGAGATLQLVGYEDGVEVFNLSGITADANGLFRTTVPAATYRPTPGTSFVSMATVVDGSQTYVSAIVVPVPNLV